ncbi:iron-siderophore ABC transporter substrate-binding protein [Saccharopolyspora sp. NPDC047091]|uniref:iron-siderophore ABC transporter substrate-binding protein n=1 Tax=Saccharopolyspora sp. NPDC047091 TaxID=3155924 RepID=UPI003410514E
MHRSARAWRGGFTALALAALLLTGACGASGPRSDAPPPSADGAFPVTLPHKYGSTTLDHRPQRVVTVGLTDHDAVLALGVVPVATTEWLVSDYPGAIGPWAADRLGGAAAPVVLDDQDGIQYERIAALKPDLILALYSDVSESEYATLSKLAPTVAQPAQHADYGVPWQEQTRTAGAALGEAPEAERLVGELEGRLADVRREHPEFGAATGLLATTYDGYFVYGRQDPRSRVFAQLGFALPAGLDEVVGDRFGVNISRERSDLLDHDVLIWFVGDGGAALRDDPVYRGLAVSRERRDIVIDEAGDYGNAFSFSSVLSLPYVLDRLVPQLTDALSR